MKKLFLMVALAAISFGSVYAAGTVDGTKMRSDTTMKKHKKMKMKKDTTMKKDTAKMM